VKGSLKLARVFGIEISVHWTFLLLIAWIVYDAWSQGATGMGIVASVLFVLAIFVCVVLHELGHALTARAFGVQTKGITLLPIGGVAALERMPTEPVQELLIALAGPAVNVVIAAVLFPAVVLLGDVQISAGAFGPFSEGFFARLAFVNVALVVFNMLPAFPMDGGRVLRALLAIWMDYAKATSIAAGAGQVMAVLFAVWGLFFGGGPLLVLIAVFVYMGGQAEAYAARARMALAGARVGDAMRREFHVLAPETTLGEAADLMLAGAQQDFPVVDEHDGLVGMLSRLRLMEGATRLGPESPVSQAMERDGQALSEDDDLLRAVEVLRSRDTAAPVTREGRIVGLLTPENVNEFMLLRAAGRKRARNGRAARPG
jgi:Zn-dependent protease